MAFPIYGIFLEPIDGECQEPSGSSQNWTESYSWGPWPFPSCPFLSSMTTRFPSLQEVVRRKETLDWAQDKPDGGSPRQFFFPRQFLFPPVPATFCLTWIASEREDRQRRLPLPGSPLWVFSQLRKWPGHQEAVRPGVKPSLSDSQAHGCLCHSSNCMNWL